MKTLVIIPAYNEEESILRVVRNLENADIDCDYIVINDCSKDSTGKILDDNNINHVDYTNKIIYFKQNIHKNGMYSSHFCT